LKCADQKQLTVPLELVQHIWHFPPVHVGQQNGSVPVHPEPQSASLPHVGTAPRSHDATDLSVAWQLVGGSLHPSALALMQSGTSYSGAAHAVPSSLH
jgi:hypothetical protein